MFVPLVTVQMASPNNCSRKSPLLACPAHLLPVAPDFKLAYQYGCPVVSDLILSSLFFFFFFRNLEILSTFTPCGYHAL